jgi:hypothetical protein
MTLLVPGFAARAEAALAALDLPAPPPIEGTEFEPRYAAAMRAVARYAAAVAAVEGDPDAHDRLVAFGPRVRLRLKRLSRLCDIGVAGTPTRKRRRHGNGSSARRQTLHEVHRALAALEDVADKAAAVAIAVVLAADDPDSALRRAEVDDWVRALTSALHELDSDADD